MAQSRTPHDPSVCPNRPCRRLANDHGYVRNHLPGRDAIWAIRQITEILRENIEVTSAVIEFVEEAFGAESPITPETYRAFTHLANYLDEIADRYEDVRLRVRDYAQWVDSRREVISIMDGFAELLEENIG